MSVTELTAKVDALAQRAGEAVLGKVNALGSRGTLAGYETPLTINKIGTVRVDKDTCDLIITSSVIEVPDGEENTSWVKLVRLTVATSVTLGSNWAWPGGSAPTIAAGGVLVLCWCGSGGIAQFVSPS